MKSKDIKRLIYDKGASLADIARAAGVSNSTVSRVISGEIRSRDVATVISRFLGKPLEALWPGKYPEVYRRRSSERVLLELAAAASHLHQEAA